MSNAVEDYDSAVAALYSPQHQSSTKEALAKSAARRTRTISDMRTYLQRAQIYAWKSTKPKILHVTGTKGKGSTACLCEGILRERYGLCTGLFTSPHLIHVQERIRINGRPISKQVLGQAYWRVRRRLEEAALSHSLRHSN